MRRCVCVCVCVCPHVGELMYGAAKVEAKSQFRFAFKVTCSLILFIISQQPSKSSLPTDIAPTGAIRAPEHRVVNMMTIPRPQRSV